LSKDFFELFIAFGQWQHRPKEIGPTEVFERDTGFLVGACLPCNGSKASAHVVFQPPDMPGHFGKWSTLASHIVWIGPTAILHREAEFANFQRRQVRSQHHWQIWDTHASEGSCHVVVVDYVRLARRPQHDGDWLFGDCHVKVMPSKIAPCSMLQLPKGRSEEEQQTDWLVSSGSQGMAIANANDRSGN